MARIPPNFSDFGKATNDLLGKDYPVGSVKLEVNTFTSNGIKFSVIGNKDNKSGEIASEIKSKYVDKLRGVAFTQSWTTSNILNSQLELENSLAKGLKVDVNASLLPNKGSKNAKFGLDYKQDHVFARTHVDLFKGPTLHGDAVIGNEGFLLGGEAAYDISDARPTKYNAAFGYVTPEYSVALHSFSAFSQFAASYFHRVNRETEAGAKAIWSKSNGNNVVVEVGGKYLLDSDAFIKGKIDNRGLLGLGYAQILRKGIKLTLGGLFDTTRLHENVHKVGMSLVLEG